jgi:DNA modification methylase
MNEITWSLKTFQIDELTDYSKNPRSLTKQQFEQLKKSLDKFGLIDKPIINADEKNTVIGGHQRLRVLRSENQKSVECWYPSRELDEKEVEELNIRLNKNTGDWDFDTLANNFEVGDLMDWGFTEMELGLYPEEDMPDDVEPQIDKAEELREKWQVQTGQLWQLGEHRLICGDCTDKAVVERVMGQDKIEICLTDPPYNVGRSYTGETNDNRSDYELWSRNWFSVAKEYTSNIAFSCGLHNVVMWASIEPWKWMLCWYKQNAMLGSPFGIGNWEPILFYGKVRKPKGSDVIVVPIVPNSAPPGHPVPKQIGVYEKLTELLTEDGEIIYDPFLGSGTTLIACERLGRKCRAVEISPAYCAVAIQRWVDVTGGKPELVQYYQDNKIEDIE